MRGEHRGAYGFRLAFPEEDGSPADLVPLAEEAPVVTVRRRDVAPAEDRYEVTPDQVVMATPLNSGFHARRDPPSIDLELSERVSLDGLVHPLLTVPMSVFARWRGDVTLHAGAFETAEGAWIVAGRREAGKSTMLASLAAAGTPIVADDLIVTQHGQVWAGPACVDVRPDAVEHFPSARNIGEVGGRERWRISTPPGRARLPVRGFFLLEWSDDGAVLVEALSAQGILSLLFEQEYIRLLGHADQLAALELAALPAWRLRRPKRWDAAQEAVASMLATVGAVPEAGR